MKNQAVLLNPLVAEDKKMIEKYRSQPDSFFIVDEIENQLEELFYIRHPAVRSASIDERNKFNKELFNGQSAENFGIWVFYPWNKYLVHFLPEDMHTELRTARNRNLITKEEQNKYYNSRIGIAGLSVGNSAVGTILHTGGGRNMRIADFDTLSGSNLNRIRTSFSKIGQKKVDIAAQEIFEVNPYADLQLFPNGLTLENLESFFLQPEPLDVLVEEMDNLYLKIQARIMARKHRIPVVMVTDNGDNIMIDVERYDLNPDRRLMNVDIPEEELLAISPDTPKPVAARIISRFVGVENIAPRMRSSLLELGKTLFSWPQLGNAALMGGCALSYCVRKILTGEPLQEGKFFISIDELLTPNYFEKATMIEREKNRAEFARALDLE